MCAEYDGKRDIPNQVMPHGGLTDQMILNNLPAKERRTREACQSGRAVEGVKQLGGSSGERRHLRRRLIEVMGVGKDPASRAWAEGVVGESLDPDRDPDGDAYDDEEQGAGPEAGARDDDGNVTGAGAGSRRALGLGGGAVGRRPRRVLLASADTRATGVNIKDKVQYVVCKQVHFMCIKYIDQHGACRSFYTGKRRFWAFWQR